LQLRQNPAATAVIIGHSDSSGAADRNQELAGERAENAKAYLMETHSIDGSRIEVRNAGSDQPMADNSTQAGRAQNRRIEIVVTIPGQ
jgi:outer membrane protein OmpA-like peptidoglycan-associated protein